MVTLNSVVVGLNPSTLVCPHILTYCHLTGVGEWSVCPSVQAMFGMGFVCLSVCTSYVWHGVCLFVRLYKLCLAWGLSVCPSVQVMFGMGFV